MFKIARLAKRSKFPNYQKKILQKLVLASGLSKSYRAWDLDSGVQVLSSVGARSVEL